MFVTSLDEFYHVFENSEMKWKEVFIFKMKLSLLKPVRSVNCMYTLHCTLVFNINIFEACDTIFSNFVLLKERTMLSTI